LRSIPSRQDDSAGVVARQKGMSDDEWEVLDNQAGVRKPEDVDHATQRVALSDSGLRDEEDQAWDEARREA